MPHLNPPPLFNSFLPHSPQLPTFHVPVRQQNLSYPSSPYPPLSSSKSSFLHVYRIPPHSPLLKVPSPGANQIPSRHPPVARKSKSFLSCFSLRKIQTLSQVRFPSSQSPPRLPVAQHAHQPLTHDQLSLGSADLVGKRKPGQANAAFPVAEKVRSLLISSMLSKTLGLHRLPLSYQSACSL